MVRMVNMRVVLCVQERWIEMQVLRKAPRKIACVQKQGGASPYRMVRVRVVRVRVVQMWIVCVHWQRRRQGRPRR